MQVVGKQPSPPQTSAWATPLSFSPSPSDAESRAAPSPSPAPAKPPPPAATAAAAAAAAAAVSSALLAPPSTVPSPSPRNLPPLRAASPPPLSPPPPPPEPPASRVYNPAAAGMRSVVAPDDVSVASSPSPPPRSSSSGPSLVSAVLPPAHPSHPLVRSESAPINLLDDDLSSGLSAFALDDPLFPPSNSSVSFAPAYTSARARASRGAPHSFGRHAHAPPPKPPPPPPRSLSSVELAGIVNAPRASVQQGPLSGIPASSRAPLATPPPIPPSSSAVAAAAARPSPAKHASNEQPWHKSVFDMIQDDFPRTPSPMFSSLLAAKQAAAASSAAHAAALHRPLQPAHRRSRLASTASLDIDLDTLPATADAQPAELSRAGARPPRDDPVERLSAAPPPRAHHRRSASVNWAGDLRGLGSEFPSGLGAEIPRSLSRSNLTSSLDSSPTARASLLSSALPQMPAASRPTMQQHSQAQMHAQQHRTQPAAAAAASTPSLLQRPQHVAPRQVALGAESVGGPGDHAAVPTAPSPQANSPSLSALRNVAHSPPHSLPVLPLAPQVGHSIQPNVTGMPQPSTAAAYSMPVGNSEPLHSHVDELVPPNISDYEYLVEQQEVLESPTPAQPATHMPAFPSQQTYSPAAQQHAAAAAAAVQGLGSHAQQQHVGSSSQYSGMFPGMGLFPSPFSTNTPNLGNGVAPGYADSFRDGMAAADNLKNMSIQMVAFITAQQQFYAAQMAQMAAIAGNSNFPNAASLSGGVPSPAGLPHLGNGSHGMQMRSPWEPRGESQSSHRNMPRQKHHFEHYRPGYGHVGKQRMGGMDTGHKNRGGRGRRGHRGHDEGLLPGHKGDRVQMGGSSMSGGIQDTSHSRSPLLEEFRATSLSIGRGIGPAGDINMAASHGAASVNQVLNAREWQLSEIKNHIVEFATDQHGSRFIQQKLESANDEDKAAILQQALTDTQRLMTDVFGNYVVQKLLDHGGSKAVKLIAKELEGRMLTLSLHMYGCRVVQKALEVLDSAHRAALVHELDGHVLKCIRDQNGNHVIQKCVELVEPEAVQFIVNSVQGQAVILAGHSYGCRVVQRILEHGAISQKAPIMVEIMSSIADLIKDQYGNYVIQHVVEHGSEEERAIIMDLVRGEVCQLSQHKFASNVVERCLQFGSFEERQVLIEILIVGEGPPNSSPLNHLVRDQFGNYVVQRVLDVALPPQRERVVNILRAQVPAIKKYSYGKHIIARLEEHHVGSSLASFQHMPSPHGVEHTAAASHVTAHRVERGGGGGSVMSGSPGHGVGQGPSDFLF